ncbi:TetR/AcrR family transcriptional regulator [Saccharibacillus alkalitolerans]|uniref:Helix-turn-helix transcriptional regulator n=1 Tax=Saccharibacillus alkalitolerans TaxID=2705290 RepID=A0ABX0FBC0_9BACL|nr:TetR family transcriptional regulator [Saccharibacillus alkalitolerans]NGZ77259.1 helix-turn-helix transcriptional regulator [Saccharibacillus alkalitolerans]
MVKQSLRDMKKEETWHVLARTSFELALEKGLDGFTIEDVVQRARYSRRTFANHFSCKEEAVSMGILSLSGASGDLHREDILREVESAPHESPVEALRQWMKMKFTANLLRELRELVVLSKAYPTLEPYVLNVLHRLQAAAQTELDRLCGGRCPQGYTHILAGAVFGAVMSILDGDIDVQIPGEAPREGAGTMAFDDFLEMTFGYLKKGF